MNDTDKAQTERMMRVLERNPRNRAYALTDDAKRHLAFLYGEADRDETFNHWLDRLTAAGWLIVRPEQEKAWEPPKPVVDPVSNKPLENPWLTPMPRDEPAQKALISERNALMQNAPELAKHFQRMASDPHKYLLELKLAEESRQRRNEANGTYNAKLHREINPFCMDNETDKGVFVRVNRTRDPERIEVFQREAIPVEPLFKPEDLLKDSLPHRKVITDIWKAPTDETQIKLKQAIQKVFERERTIRLIEYQREESERQESVKRAMKDAENLRAATIGLSHTASGQIITAGMAKGKREQRTP